MSKTLVIILHYNTTFYTDQLYEMLAPSAGSDYDLSVIDNGSDKGRESKYADYRLDTNVYFGGGLNAAFDLFLESPQYDSLMFLNSDLIVHGESFIKNLRRALPTYDLISPCVYQPEKTQNHWRQMLNWGNQNYRDVKWIDLQSPLFSRKFIDKVRTVDDLLLYGWGIDVLFGILAEQYNMKACVVDSVPVVHLGSATMKEMNIVNKYCRKAEEGQREFFLRNGLMNKAVEFRTWAENYTT
jgi:hypothetical protein